MASLITCVTTSLTWCFCQACTSLLCACCGNDKPSTVPPSATSGRRRSVFVLILSIGLALAFQYGIAPYLVDLSINNFIRDNWIDGCSEYEDDVDLQKSCAGNNGNFRVSSATFLFFVLAAIAALLKPTANREAWPAKYILYLFLVGITVLIPSEPLFSDIFLNIARIGGALFVVVQQFVIIDMAHNWNESWVDKSNKADAEELGSGRKWLIAILLSCALLYIVSIILLIYMFLEFTGCPSNAAFMSVTLILVVSIHVAQLTGEEGSLLSSSVVSAWAIFLCYTAVSKNPNGDCNPRVGENEPLSVAFGLIMTILSLGWAGYSYTAEDKLVLKSNNDEAATEQPASGEATNETGGRKKVTGFVTYGSNVEEEQQEDAQGNANEEDDENMAGGNDPRKLSNSWRLNAALAVVACWKSMILTHWGEIASDGTLANSSAGRIGMWMVIGSQWLALSLYLWTLVAPRLLPDRDFS